MNETFYNILPSGMKIVHKKTPSEVVYVGIMVGAGTRHEDTKYNGLAHYIEHCVFKGTEKRTAREIINCVEDVGGEINAYTTKEETTFYVAVPRAHWKKAASLLADMILHPTFPKDETDKETQVILDEIESYEDSPSELIYDDFEALLYSGESLALPILGSRKSLNAISKTNGRAPREWMQRHYTPDRMVFFTEGNIEMASVIHCAERLFSNPKTENPEPITDPIGAPDAALPWWGKRRHRSPADDGVVSLCDPIAERAREPRTETYRKHTHQTHVMIGGPAYTMYDERQPGLYLLNNILGGGSLNSRLNLSLREDAGLVYTIESQYNPLSDTGYWNVYFASDDCDRERCLELVWQEIRRLKEKPLSRYQLDKALRQLYGQMAISAENRENRFLAMAKQMLYFGESPTWQESFEKVARFTPAQLCDIANEVYDEDHFVTLIYA